MNKYVSLKTLKGIFKSYINILFDITISKNNNKEYENLYSNVIRFYEYKPNIRKLKNYINHEEKDYNWMYIIIYPYPDGYEGNLDCSDKNVEMLFLYMMSNIFKEIGKFHLYEKMLNSIHPRQEYELFTHLCMDDNNIHQCCLSPYQSFIIKMKYKQLKRIINQKKKDIIYSKLILYHILPNDIISHINQYI